VDNAYADERRLDDAEPLRTEAEEIRLRWHLQKRPEYAPLLSRVRAHFRQLFRKWY
jgi:hypothetical protein